ncbi:MAG: GFA family protein [Amphritea sp.]
MAEVISATGKCLCGAVGVTVKNINNSFSACHCSICRKWGGGGPLMALDCGTDVSIEGEESISVFDSSTWAERGFCSNCGTHLFYRIKQNQGYIIPIGLFDTKKVDDDQFDSEQFKFDLQIFIDEKPGYYCFSNATKLMTGAEVFAMYGPSDK